MACVSRRQVLDHAAEHGYAVPAFNVNNLEQVQAIMEAARDTDPPVILQACAGARTYAGEAYLRHVQTTAPKPAWIPASCEWRPSHKPRTDTGGNGSEVEHRPEFGVPAFALSPKPRQQRLSRAQEKGQNKSGFGNVVVCGLPPQDPLFQPVHACAGCCPHDTDQATISPHDPVCRAAPAPVSGCHAPDALQSTSLASKLANATVANGRRCGDNFSFRDTRTSPIPAARHPARVFMDKT